MIKHRAYLFDSQKYGLLIKLVMDVNGKLNG